MGREERSPSTGSGVSSVAPPKLLVSKSALLSVCSVKGYIRFPAVISFCDREHVYTLIDPCSSQKRSTSCGATWCKSWPRIKLNLAGDFFIQLCLLAQASVSKLYFLANLPLQVRIFLFSWWARSSNPECCSRRRFTTSPPGICTWKLASRPSTVSA